MSKKIEVIDVKEEEDGGATITLELGSEAVEMLVQYAVKDILTKAAERDLTDKDVLRKFGMEVD